MPTDVAADRRLDPRLRAALALFPPMRVTDVASRDEYLAEVSTEEAQQAQVFVKMFFDSAGDETVAPSAGLRFAEHRITSQPDGNEIPIFVIRPDDDQVRPCVYYIHGGGMASLSCTYGNYQAWGRLVAAAGAVVAMVDFRNCINPSSVPEVAPYPAGLNDCVSGLRWVHANAAALGADSSRIVVSGESGGGNLTLATGMRLLRDGGIGLISGLYAFCPYIAGHWPQDRLPSSIENNGIFLDLRHNRGRVGYGIEAFEARDPLAWPGFATVDDVRGLPRTVISVNECDPLRDEGIEFYRLLLEAGVPARCVQVMGTMHATEMFPAVCPDVSKASAHALAAFAVC